MPSPLSRSAVGPTIPAAEIATDFERQRQERPEAVAADLRRYA
jgi:hypothetical protein